RVLFRSRTGRTTDKKEGRVVGKYRIKKEVQGSRRGASSAFFSIFTAMIQKTILPLCYLPPLSWFWAYLQGREGEILLDKQEHFPKQAHRNRCLVHWPSVRPALSIRGTTGPGEYAAYKDVRIGRHQPSLHSHWRSLEAAYRSRAL